MRTSCRVAIVFTVFVSSGSLQILRAQQPLETETARPPAARSIQVQTTFEYQTSSQGTELAVPFGLEYGITDRLSVLAEPVFYTSIRPEQALRATGVGDLEITLSYLVAHERRRLPAFAIAGEVKAPTARNILIGTRRTDLAAYLIASKRVGKFDTHLNMAYTIVGKPVGVPLDNIFNFAAAEEYFVSRKWVLIGEVLANTASTAGGGEGITLGNQGGISPEAPAGEVVGMLGFRYRIRDQIYFAFGVNYDSNGAVLFRQGFTFNFDRRGGTQPR